MPTGKGTPLQLSGASGAGVTSSTTAVSHPHPYRHPILSGNYEDDFPLRKTGTVIHSARDQSIRIEFSSSLIIS